MKFRLLVERDAETQRWSALFPDLPGCATAGDIEDEAIANAKAALQLWFEPAPIEVPQTARERRACPLATTTDELGPLETAIGY